MRSILKVASLLSVVVLVSSCNHNKEAAIDAGDAQSSGASLGSGSSSDSGSSASVRADDSASASTGGSDLLSPQEALLREVGDRIFFDYDSAALEAMARRTVEALAVWLDQNPRTSLIVEGHCDERGTREYNLALGERRAEAVRSYLTALGISGARLETVSYGKERPAVLGSSDRSWALNRRSVFDVR